MKGGASVNRTGYANPTSREPSAIEPSAIEPSTADRGLLTPGPSERRWREPDARDPNARDPISFERGPLTPSPPVPSHAKASHAQPAQPPHAQHAPSPSRTRSAMRTAIYLLGLLTILGALAWAALLLGVPSEWIGVGSLFGLGVVLIKGTRYTPHQR